jgi:transcriptional regulator with XRE-family HTH domain
MTLGARIAELRKEHGLSQAQLAKRLGISQPAAANYERDMRDPPAQLLIRLCTEFNVNAAWLLLGVGNMANQDIDAHFTQAVRVAWAHLANVHDHVTEEKLLTLSTALFRYLKKHNELSDDMIDNFLKMVA